MQVFQYKFEAIWIYEKCTLWWNIFWWFDLGRFEILHRKKNGLKIDATTEAIADMRTLIVNELVSKLRAYEVANEIVHDLKVKNKRYGMFNKATVIDSNDKE